MASDEKGTSIQFPQYYMEIDGIKFANNKIPGLDNFIPIADWGFGVSHLSGNNSVGPYDPKQPPAATFLYVRMPSGGYLPSLFSCLFDKKVMDKAKIVRLGNMTKTDQLLGGLHFEKVTIEKILMGNTSSFDLGGVEGDFDNATESTFEMFLRFLELKVEDHEFEQNGSKKGITASSYDFSTGKVKK